MLFIDYSSAFNTVTPSMPTNKLYNLGVPPTHCIWVLDVLVGSPHVTSLLRSGHEREPSPEFWATTSFPHGHKSGHPACHEVPSLVDWLSVASCILIIFVVDYLGLFIDFVSLPRLWYSLLPLFWPWTVFLFTLPCCPLYIFSLHIWVTVSHSVHGFSLFRLRRTHATPQSVRIGKHTSKSITIITGTLQG